MPALHLFGRRTKIGGDDLTSLAFIDLLLRLLQIIMSIPLFIHGVNVASNLSLTTTSSSSLLSPFNDNETDANTNANANTNDKTTTTTDPTITSCRYDDLFTRFLFIYGATSIVYAIADAIIVAYPLGYWTRQGAPTINTEPRTSKVQQLLQWKLFWPFSIVLFCMMALGVTLQWLVVHDHKCQSQRGNDTIARKMSRSSGSILVITQLIELGITWTYLVFLVTTKPKPKIQSSATMEEEGQGKVNEEEEQEQQLQQQQQRRQHQEQVWVRRCSCCCICLSLSTCFLAGGQEVVFGGSRWCCKNNNNTNNKKKQNQQDQQEEWQPSTNRGSIVVDFNAMAQALTDFFDTGGILDLIPSDITVGICILQQVQRSRARQLRHQILCAQQAAAAAALLLGTTTRNPVAIVTTNNQPIAKMNGTRKETQNSQAADDHNDDDGCDPIAETRTLPRPVAVAVAENKDPVVVVVVTGDDLTAPANSKIDEREGQETTIAQTGQLQKPYLSNSIESGDMQHPLSDSKPKNTTSHSTEKSGIAQPPRLLSKDNTADVADLQEGSRYIKYALAMYTYTFYLLAHPVTGIPRLVLKGTRTCCCLPQHCCMSSNRNHQDLSDDKYYFGYIRGDNLCSFHKSALLLSIGLSNDADLVYLQLKSSFKDAPYSIVLDHEWKSVVLSIRGTFSVEDAVKDALIEYAALDELGREFGFDGENQHCHAGVLLTARSVLEDLGRHKLLEQLLVGDNARYPDYTLRVVGHSLGAGAGAMLSYLLRQQFPTLKCAAFSPPGCTLSWDLAIKCQEWCTSFVLDSDIVPRLSVESMEAWRDELLDVIGRIKVSKIEVFKRSWKMLKKQPRAAPPEIDLERMSESLEDDMAEILYKPDEVPETEYQRQLERYKRLQQEQRNLRRGNVSLYPPGRIIHYVKTDEKGAVVVGGVVKCLTCFTTNFHFEYTPIRINNDGLREIAITPRMLNDHFPDRVRQVAEEVAKAYQS
ncbi:hypothetical protein ACA910_019634 [Epithemia clementina (nom. ined.)]